MLDMKKGDKDIDGETITRVYTKHGDYAIYSTEEDPVRCAFAPSGRRQELINRSHEISLELSRIRSLQTGRLIHHELVNAETVRALTQCLEGDTETAKAILSETEQRLLKLRSINGRMHYLVSCMATICITTALLVSLSFFMRQSLQEDTMSFLYAILCGSLGGFLSVSLSLNKLDVDPDAPWGINVISGASRILIAMIGSAFVYLLVKANIIFGFVSQSESVFSLLAISLVAGFSETLVPNLLRKIESEQVAINNRDDSHRDNLPERPGAG